MTATSEPSKNEIERSTYWDSYYRAKAAPRVPSQFATFVASEFSKGVTGLVDVGCGSGRDSFFFSQVGYPVLGIDGSSSAVELCMERGKSQPQNASSPTFMRADVRDPTLPERVIEWSTSMGAQGHLGLYARFFLHAITDEDERAFLDGITGILRQRGGRLALEFRTIRDKLQQKVTADHFRRYIDPVAFFARAQTHGLHVEYFVEGFGFAKYKDDDAHVARFLLAMK